MTQYQEGLWRCVKSLSECQLSPASGILFLNNCVFFSAVGWLPTFLELRGFELVSAASISALFAFFGIPAILVVGYLSDRTRSRRPILFGSTLTVMVISYLMISASLPLLPLLIAAMGVAVASWFVICLILPADIASQKSVGTVAGVVFSIGYFGGLFGPWIFGYLLDFTGGFESGLLALLLFSAIGLTLTLTMPSERIPKLAFR